MKNPKMKIPNNVVLFVSIILLTTTLACAKKEEALIFNFGNEVTSGFGVNDETVWPFSHEGIKYGVSGNVETRGNYMTSKEPFIFWTEVPEGNYRVQVVLGDEIGPTNMTIKAESRRLMIYDHTVLSKSDTVEFVVNVRTPRIDDQTRIKTKPREVDYVNWDNNISLEFGGERPCVRSISILKDETVPTIFLTGNSTVVDQEMEPWASWGQMFTAFLKPQIAVANFAESGETLKGFIWEKRFDKIASMIKPGDYLFMEFAHNDQKPGPAHVDPYTTYDEYLMKFVNLARENGATPVLVTSTNRRKFDENGEIENTLEEYPDAVRQLAEKENVFLVDLNAMSKELYEALGVEGSKNAFVHYPAGTFEGQDEPLADNTHFNTYGAWQLAKCIVQGIKDGDCALKEYLKDDIQDYDPANPDAFESWKWPMSPNGSVIKPDGN